MDCERLETCRLWFLSYCYVPLRSSLLQIHASCLFCLVLDVNRCALCAGGTKRATRTRWKQRRGLVVRGTPSRRRYWRWRHPAVMTGPPTAASCGTGLCLREANWTPGWLSAWTVSCTRQLYSCSVLMVSLLILVCLSVCLSVHHLRIHYWYLHPSTCPLHWTIYFPSLHHFFLPFFLSPASYT
jgi:hypothetical protein